MTTVRDYDREIDPYSYEVLDDGFGNYWPKCSSDCDLEIVRPGKAQCSGYCDSLPGWLTEPPLDDWTKECRRG